MHYGDARIKFRVVGVTYAGNITTVEFLVVA